MLGRTLALATALLLATPSSAATETGRARPNILLVLLDDVGFMDFGAYGSDAATPSIDNLAHAGVMFTRYYTQPLCGPSRASLMTGQDNHVVGAGTLAEALTPEMRALPAYSMKWRDGQQTIASRLKADGYQTFVAGKWGIGDIGANLPHRFGFDRSWVLDSTGSSNYRAKPYLPIYTEVKWFEDGERVSLPEDFYSSRSIVDKMIEYVDDADPARPFFGYLSFQAVHIPVQVPREYVDKYNGVFDRGWGVMREERLQRAIKLGLVPQGTRLADGPYNGRKWEDLTEEEKAYWARVMQVNAGMLEAADAHLGRLLDHLKAKGQLDNTIVVVTSDNGPEYNTEGGVRVPMVMSGPGIRKLGVVHARSQVTDIVPTLLELAGVPHAADEFYGRSLAPLLTGAADQVYGESDSFAIEVSGTAALYRGDWKLTRTPAPYSDGEWRLYDIVRDPGETTDLAARHPDVFEELQQAFAAYAEEVGVFELAEGESARHQIVINSLKKFSKNYWYVVAAVLAVILGLLYGVYVGARRHFGRRLT